MEFYTRAEFLDTKLLVFTLPKASAQTRMQNTFMVILLILIHGPTLANTLPTLRAKRTTRCKWSILPDSALHVQLLMQEH